LWQSLVGQHVRFPKTWFGGLRSPPMGADASWYYLTRHAVRNHSVLNHLVRNRSAPGRLLVHLIVRDFMMGTAVLDICVGVFHPSARGIRSTEHPDPKEEQCRHVWMAVRKRAKAVSLLDNMLCRGERLESIAQESPLGGTRRSVSNVNMRAVFGEEPPLHTVCIQESELYEKMSAAAQVDPRAAQTPDMLILHEFLLLA
jgi:hypothetical protein